MIDERKFENKWAFLVGVSEYIHVRRLGWAANDADDLTKSLIQDLGFAKDNVVTLSDNSVPESLKPGYSNIWHQLSEFTRRKIAEKDLIIFYFSGHGTRDDKEDLDRILPIDATPSDLEDTGILVSRVLRMLRTTGCKNIVLFLDMCREDPQDDGAKGVMLAEGAKNVVQDRWVRATMKGRDSAIAELVQSQEGLATFYSCTAQEYSYEIDEFRHGSFTHWILEAIKDEQVVTAGELSEYLQRNVPDCNSRHNKNVQWPYLIPNPYGMASLPLLQLPPRPPPPELESLAEAIDDGRLPDDFLAEAVPLFERGPETASDYKKLRLLRDFNGGHLQAKSFVAAFRSPSRQSLGELKIQGRDALLGGRRPGYEDLA